MRLLSVGGNWYHTSVCVDLGGLRKCVSRLPRGLEQPGCEPGRPPAYGLLYRAPESDGSAVSRSERFGRGRRLRGAP